jgi:hypothetical protein
MKTPEEIKESNKLRDVITEILERRPGVGATYELLHLFENLMREKSSSQIEDLTKEVETRRDAMVRYMELMTKKDEEVERLKATILNSETFAAYEKEKALADRYREALKSIYRKDVDLQDFVEATKRYFEEKLHPLVKEGE